MDNKQFYYEEGPVIKRIRPWALIVTLGYFLLIALLDGNWGEFVVKEIYLKILENILIAMIAFLYGSRGVEKVSQIMQRKTLFSMRKPLSERNAYRDQDDYLDTDDYRDTEDILYELEKDAHKYKLSKQQADIMERIEDIERANNLR